MRVERSTWEGIGWPSDDELKVFLVDSNSDI